MLRGEATVAMRRTVARAARAPKVRGAALALGAAAQSLFERLRAWRGAEARAQGVPAYVILHDRTLAAIAQTEPVDLAALARVDGIGTVKLARYGEAIIGLVSGAEVPGSV